MAALALYTNDPVRPNVVLTVKADVHEAAEGAPVEGDVPFVRSTVTP